MALPVLVVDRDAAVQQSGELARIERLFELDREQGLGLVEDEAAVAVGGGDQRLARRRGQRQRPLHQRLGAVEQLAQRRAVEAVEDQHLAARQQGRVELERGIFGGGADQHHRAVLDIGQEAVLLGAVEAVDLVHEQQGLLADPDMLARLGEHLLQVGDAREDRRDGDEAHADRIGEQAGDRRLAGAGRPPQDHRGELARRHHPPDRAVGAGQMLLPDHVLEPLRPQPVGERRILRRRRRAGRGRGLVLEKISHTRRLAHFAEIGTRVMAGLSSLSRSDGEGDRP